MGDEEGPPQWVQDTKATLGTLIKRPKLTDPLLQKPPFRFVHDIVSEVTKATGFATGLYDGDELNSAKIKDKDTKVAYLTKIIRCVEISLSQQITIRAGKVVAGLESENTNVFLQLLFQAATSCSEDQSNSAVAQVLADAPKIAPAPPPAADIPAIPVMPPPQPAVDVGAFAHELAAPPVAAPVAAPDREPMQMTSMAPRKPPEEEEAPAADEPKRTRPKSARRAPPKLTTNEVKVDKRAAEGGGAAIPGVIMDGEQDAEEDEMIMMVNEQMEPVGDNTGMLMDPSGEGHGKLVRNILDAKQEMESQSNEKDAPLQEGDTEGPGGIILGKKGGKAAGNQKALPSKNEINSLRTTIQTLCQSSNPLGRCLEYVQEDLESMGKELETWRQLRRRRTAELAEEEAATASSLIPLQAELAKMDDLIKEKQGLIRYAKANIIRNDSTVEALLSQVVRT